MSLSSGNRFEEEAVGLFLLLGVAFGDSNDLTHATRLVRVPTGPDDDRQRCIVVFEISVFLPFDRLRELINKLTFPARIGRHDSCGASDVSGLQLDRSGEGNVCGL